MYHALIWDAEQGLVVENIPPRPSIWHSIVILAISYRLIFLLIK
jgi:hypothetical protein